MTRYTAEEKKKKKKKKWKRKTSSPTFTKVKPTLSDSSIDVPRIPLNLKKSLMTMSCVDQYSCLLFPAVVLVPSISGADMVSQKYKKLQGEDRNILLAAAHVEDAKTGRGEYGKAKYYFKPRHAQRAFSIITNQWFVRLLYLTVVLHSIMTFLEPPSVRKEDFNLTLIAIGLDFLCLLLYTLDVVLHLDFLSCKAFWTKSDFFWNRVEFLFLCGFTIDLILLIVQVSAKIDEIVQPFRALRLAMVVCKAKNLGHIYNVVQSIIFKLGGIVMIFLVFIIMYSCIGVHLLMKPFEVIDDINITSFRPEQEVDLRTVLRNNVDLTGLTMEDIQIVAETCAVASQSAFNESSIYQGTFDNIGLGSYQLFILLSTENYPVFMFPAFQQSEWYFIYFGSFLTFGVFFLTAILLAIIADIYWVYNKKYVKKERNKQRAELVKAWKLLDSFGNEKIAVSDPQLVKLFHLLKPKNTQEENEDLIAELDPNGTQYVDWIQWVTKILDILDFEKASNYWRPCTKSKCCNNSCIIFIMRQTRKLIRKRASEITFLLLIVAHSILFTFKWNGMSALAELIVQGIRSGILVIFLIEMLLRFVAYGSGFFKFFNMFDLTLVMLAMVTNGIWYLTLLEIFSSANIELWKACMVVISSVAIFFRLFFNSAKSRGVMTVFLRLFPIMGELLVLFGIVLYLYAVIGMEAFSKLEISDDTPYSDYFQYNCGVGFRDFKCSLYIMFQLLTTSNWHEIMNSMILTVDTFTPIVYFVSFYIVVDLVIMNLLVAIGLEAFNKFRQDQREEAEEEEEKMKMEEDQQESKKKTKITGRFLIKGVVDILADTLSAPQELQDNAFDGEEEEEEEEDENSTTNRRTHSAPANRSAQSRINVRPNSGPEVRTPVMGLTSIVFPSYSPPTSTTGKITPTSAGPTATRKPSTLPLHVEPHTPPHTPPHNVLTVEADVSDLTGVSVEGGEEGGAALTSQTQRQDHLRKKLQEKNKGKRRQTLTDPPTPLSYSSAEKGVVTPTTPTERVVPVRARKLGISKQEASTSNQVLTFPTPSSKQLKFDLSQVESPTRKGRRATIAGPKFRKVHHGDNWRSEVQDITIINKEEISELRKQLASKPLKNLKQNFPTDPKGSLLSEKVQREPLLSADRPKSTLAPDHSQDFILSNPERKDSTIVSGKSIAMSNINLNFGSSDSLDVDRASPINLENATSFSDAPLISVEETPEDEKPPIASSIHSKPRALGKKASLIRGKRERKKEKKGEDVPNWLLQLTQKHNVALSESDGVEK